MARTSKSRYPGTPLSRYRGGTVEWGTPGQRRLAHALFALPGSPIMDIHSLSSERVQPFIECLERELKEGELKYYRPVLMHCGFWDANDSEGTLLRLVEMVVIVMKETEDDEISIDDVISELSTRNGVNATDESPPPLVRQGIFSLLGWMTRLFKISDNVSQTHLSILEPRQLPVAYPRKDIDEAALALGTLVVSFGRFVPRPLEERFVFKTVQRKAPQSVDLNIAYMNASALTEIGKIRLEWSDLLSAHLIFDPARRTLLLFSLPSFCALNCAAEKDSTVFD
ncbi:MAG: hypothetical protein Q9218_002563 [Villophora microphyllina]